MDAIDKLTSFAKENAPSYVHMPDDGDGFTCQSCKTKKSHKVMVRCFLPDGSAHNLCTDGRDQWGDWCIDREWLKNAKDCGKF